MIWTVFLLSPLAVLAERFWGEGQRWVLFAATSFLLIIITFLWSLKRVPPHRHSYDTIGNLVLLLPVLLLFSLITLLPIKRRGSWIENPDTFAPYVVIATFGALILTALIWETQFLTAYDRFTFLRSRDDRFRAQLLVEAENWISNYSGLSVESYARRRTDLTFTLLAALLLNAFTLLGSLERPFLFSVGYFIVTVVLLIVWSIRVGRWQKEAATLTGSWREVVYPVAVAFFGAALFIWNSALSSVEHRSWISMLFEKESHLGPYPVIVSERTLEEIFAWSNVAPKSDVDLRIFGAQLVVVALTTAIPFMTHWLFRRPITRRMVPKGFEIQGRSGAILQVDQALGRIVAGDRKSPRFGRSISVDVLDGGADTVTWRSKWSPSGRGNARRYQYRYSVFTVGRHFYVVGLGGRPICRWFVSLRERFNAKTPGWGSCPFEVRSIHSGRCASTGLNLAAHGVAPYIPPALVNRTVRFS